MKQAIWTTAWHQFRRYGKPHAVFFLAVTCITSTHTSLARASHMARLYIHAVVQYNPPPRDATNSSEKCSLPNAVYLGRWALLFMEWTVLGNGM